MNISSMDEAFKITEARKLIMYENRQTLEYRTRKDFTNKYVEFSVTRLCFLPFERPQTG